MVLLVNNRLFTFWFQTKFAMTLTTLWLVLLSKDIRYAKNALSRFNVTSVVRAAIGSVNLLAK